MRLKFSTNGRSCYLTGTYAFGAGPTTPLSHWMLAGKPVNIKYESMTFRQLDIFISKYVCTV